MVRAFYNVCPHRGNRLVEAEQGHSKNIACAYHGWRFAPEGNLKFVPCPEDFAGGSPCGRVALKPVRCETFAGFVWVNMDPGAAVDEGRDLSELRSPQEMPIDVIDLVPYCSFRPVPLVAVVDVDDADVSRSVKELICRIPPPALL